MKNNNVAYIEKSILIQQVKETPIADISLSERMHCMCCHTFMCCPPAGVIQGNVMKIERASI